AMSDPRGKVKPIATQQSPEAMREHPDGKALIALLVKHHEALSLSDREMGHAHGVIHEIDTGDARPIALPIRRMPYSDREEVKKQLTDLLAAGVIAHSNSEWAFPTVLVRKKDDNKIRVCIDYRELNLVTVKDRYPLPRCDDLLDMAGQGGAKYFTKLDLKAGYHHIKMSDDARRKSAFITWMGNNPMLFEFVYMPFGLVAAPATFQRCMNNALRGLDQSKVFCYLDDILIATKTVDDHIETLDGVLTKLTENGMKLKPSKCE
ncbi:MAG: RNA-directed DNA polymerase, partial [bacterium]|nr:RNA-directed DNA polymerase [bacterium]